ncbi:hypothetical protein BXU10_02700 [Flavobacterium sp. LM4]|nr:hypothetical protein BXU10_02700 [Flavobacterium sp. LM4]
MLLILVFIAFSAIISCSESSESTDNVTNSGSGLSTTNSNCPTKTCPDFKTQAEAQAAYNSNPKCYKKLDHDGNGKACESLK